MVARVLVDGEGKELSSKARPASGPARSASYVRAFDVRRLGASDLKASAQLHQEVLAAEFVARAGERFLRLYHRAWCESPYGLSLAATGPRGELLGVLLGSLQPGAHYRYIAKRHGLGLVVRLIGHSVANPSFAWELLKTRAVRYALGALRLLARRRGPTCGPVAEVKEGEVAHLMVAPGARGAGVGRALVQEALRLAEEAGLGQVVLVTLPEDASNGFYLHLGWEPYGEVTSRSGEHFTRFRWVFSRRGEL